MLISRLPPIPRPPHDPTWLLLNDRVGWREAYRRDVEVAAGGQLTLAYRPDAGRLLAEPSGSLGGLVPPRGMALAPDGTLFALDPRGPTLKVFDPCACRFVPVPCFGGAGGGPRQLQAPEGIAVGGGNLYVCDTGNRRLGVFALHGYALLGHWRPPAATGLAPTWQPQAVACDSRGRVFVADPANGCIHRFHRTGRWETQLAGLGAVTRLAIDRADRLYVGVDGLAGVRILDPDGQDLGRAVRPDEIGDRFPRLPFTVDAQGRLDLTAMCPACGPGGRTPRRPSAALFDRYGERVEDRPAPAAPLYVHEGLWIAGPLDSEIYRCQWHRIILRGCVPAGAQLRLSTYTSETEQPVAMLLDAEELWETRQPAQTEGEEWDCLVRSGGGRYLWLRLQLAGPGSATPAVASIRLEFPRVSLRRYLPAVFGEDPVSADFTDRFLSLFDTTLRSVEHTLDTQARFFDPLSAPAAREQGGASDFLTWLASWVGVALDRQWSEARRRQWLKQAVRLYPIRGTRAGMRRALQLFLGIDAERRCRADAVPRTTGQPRPCHCRPAEERPSGWDPPQLILEHYQLRRWLFVGQGRLGDRAVLWGQRIVNRSQLDTGAQGAQVGRTQLISTPDPYHDPFRVYAHRFTVFVPARCGRSDTERRALENLVQAEKPAHTLAQIEYVAPRFRIGVQSMIGYDAVIGRYPEGVRLNETELGPASVLGGAPGRSDQPTLVVGRQARVGATTRLG